MGIPIKRAYSLEERESMVVSQEASGLSVRAYAEAIGVSISTLYKMRIELGVAKRKGFPREEYTREGKVMGPAPLDRCARGHAMKKPNLYFFSNGSRGCRSCAKERRAMRKRSPRQLAANCKRGHARRARRQAVCVPCAAERQRLNKALRAAHLIGAPLDGIMAEGRARGWNVDRWLEKIEQQHRNQDSWERARKHHSLVVSQLRSKGLRGGRRNARLSQIVESRLLLTSPQ